MAGAALAAVAAEAYARSVNSVLTARIGAILAGLAVAFGAFGAHGLEGLVTEARLGTFETGVRYQMYHGLGLLLVSVLGGRALAAAPWLLAGSVIFSGSLYLLVLTDTGWLGAVAPIGGATQIAGWFILALQVGRQSRAGGSPRAARTEG